MSIKCECGGTLRCDRCGVEVLPGPTIRTLRNQLAALILSSPDRLPPKQLAFLRRYLGLTQAELAKRLGIARKTVVQWEGKGAISPQYDLLLRLLAYAHLEAADRPELDVLTHVRKGAAKRRGPLVVRAA